MSPSVGTSLSRGSILEQPQFDRLLSHLIFAPAEEFSNPWPPEWT
jgi:hypothetical protein